MSRVKAGQPKRLAEKLKKVRLDLWLAQEAEKATLFEGRKAITVLFDVFMSRLDPDAQVPSGIGRIPADYLRRETAAG